MHHQNDRLGRILWGGGPVYCSILGILEATAGVGFSHRHSALYGAAEFARCALRAAATNRSLHSAAHSLRRRIPWRMPASERYRALLAGARIGAAAAAAAAAGRAQTAELARLGMLPKSCRVAVDMHGITRYDAGPGPGPARGREKSGTDTHERYMTAQCAERRTPITAGFAAAGALDDVCYATHNMVRRARTACGDAGTEPVFLMDREFQTVRILRMLLGEGVRFAIPCRNTVRIVAALREHAAGQRSRVSRVVLEGIGGEVEVTIVIERRKKRSGRSMNAESGLIVFAVSDPGVDVGSYSKRWAIETRYRELEKARVRSSTKSAAGRAVCFAYSLLILNAWAMACVAASAESSGRAGGGPSIPHDEFSDIIMDLSEWDGLLPEPPPEPAWP